MTTQWSIRGPQVSNCNCDYGCPCQFNASPTRGYCTALSAGEIESGHHGEVSLDGLRWACLFNWPGPIHEGDGEMQIILEERSGQPQRDALRRILSGEDTAPGATHFNVFAATMTIFHEPAFANIEFYSDIDARSARVRIESLLDSLIEPIRNPVTNAPHRIRIQAPHGFEFTEAEVGSGTTSATGAIPLELNNSHAHLVRLNMTGAGVVR